MLKALIVEDEPRSRLMLKNFVDNYCQGVHVIGETATVEGGISFIIDHKPDLVLLDVELEDGKGMEILDHFKTQQFITILITGYDHYAIEAIKKDALDYILKPVVIRELREAIEKAKKKIAELDLLMGLQNKEDITPIDDHKIVIVNDKKKRQIINCQDLLYIEAKNQYTKWHLKETSNLFFRKSLKEYDMILPEYFYQIHKSYIINLNYVTSYDKKGRGGFVQINDIQLPISYRRKTDFILRLKQVIPHLT